MTWKVSAGVRIVCYFRQREPTSPRLDRDFVVMLSNHRGTVTLPVSKETAEAVLRELDPQALVDFAPRMASEPETVGGPTPWTWREHLRFYFTGKSP